MAPRRRRADGEEPEQVLYLPDPPAPGGTAVLSGGEADHARRSLRLRLQDPVSLVDGNGRRFRGTVSGLGKSEMRVRVDSMEILDPWPREEIWLGAGVLRSTRMDTLVEKASELGVSRLCPLVLDRSVARPHEEGAKEQRWQRLAVESMKQCRRARLMEVLPPRSLEAFLEEVPDGATLWAADPGGEPPAEAGIGPGEGPVILVVGPEGGLAGPEIELLGARGARWVALGGNRLRAETAAMTLVVAALGVLGALRAPSKGAT